MPAFSRREVLRALGASAATAALSPLTGMTARAAGLGVGSSPAGELDSTVAHDWFDLTRRLVRGTAGFSPPVASRAFACIAVALYEALVPGMPGYRSLAGTVPDLVPLPAAGRNAAYHWPSVANRVLAAINRLSFPTAPATLKAVIDGLEDRYSGEFRSATAPGVYNRSVDRGAAIAAAVFDWGRNDGGHEGYLHNFPSDYAPPAGPGLWVPTLPAFSGALQPRWGANRCMALPAGDMCAPPPPPEYSVHPASAFFAEGLEVYETVSHLTPEQLTIARFWSDDAGATATPAGHSISITTQALRARNASLEEAAVAYLRVGIAVADAFVACWNAKFRFNLLRPISYVRAAIDPTWGDPSGPHPLPLTTPPFPEYTSGHSVQSAAAATVLTALFGERPFTDHTHDERGFEPRHFSSFEAAAQEAAISRLYGGIHFRSGIERGLEQGRCIGNHVNALRLRE